MIGVGPPDAGARGVRGVSASAENVIVSLRRGTSHGTIRTLVSDIARVHRSSMITTIIVKSLACFLLRSRERSTLGIPSGRVGVGGSQFNCPLR